MTRISDMIAAKGHVKAKKLAALAEQAAPAPAPKAPWTAATFSRLKPGACRDRGPAAPVPVPPVLRGAEAPSRHAPPTAPRAGANQGVLLSCRIVVEGTPAGENPIPLCVILLAGQICSCAPRPFCDSARLVSVPARAQVLYNDGLERGLLRTQRLRCASPGCRQNLLTRSKPQPRPHA